MGKDLPNGLLPVCARGTVRGPARGRPPSNRSNRSNRRRIPSLTTLVLGTTLGLAIALTLLAWLPQIRRAPLLQTATQGTRAPGLLVNPGRGSEAAAAGVAGVAAGAGGSTRRAPGVQVVSTAEAGVADGYRGDGVAHGSSGSSGGWESIGEGGSSTQRLDGVPPLSPQQSLAPSIVLHTDLYSGAEAEAVVEAEVVSEWIEAEDGATEGSVGVAEALAPGTAPVPKRSSSIATTITTGIPSPDPAPGGTAPSPAVDPASTSTGPILGPVTGIAPPPLSAGPVVPIVPLISSEPALAPPPLAAGPAAPHKPRVFLGELSSPQARVPLSLALNLTAWQHLTLRLPQLAQEEVREGGGVVDGRQLQEEEMRSLWGQGAAAGGHRGPGAGLGAGPVRLLVAVISRCCDPEVRGVGKGGRCTCGEEYCAWCSSAGCMVHVGLAAATSLLAPRGAHKVHVLRSGR